MSVDSGFIGTLTRKEIMFKVETPNRHQNPKEAMYVFIFNEAVFTIPFSKRDQSFEVAFCLRFQAISEHLLSLQ